MLSGCAKSLNRDAPSRIREVLGAISGLGLFHVSGMEASKLCAFKTPSFTSIQTVNILAKRTYSTSELPDSIKMAELRSHQLSQNGKSTTLCVAHVNDGKSAKTVSDYIETHATDTPARVLIIGLDQSCDHMAVMTSLVPIRPALVIFTNSSGDSEPPGSLNAMWQDAKAAVKIRFRCREMMQAGARVALAKAVHEVGSSDRGLVCICGSRQLLQEAEDALQDPGTWD